MHLEVISTPLILGSASLIAFISVRSASISDRIREANREVIAPNTTLARRKNLVERQIRRLKRRFMFSNYALLCLLLAFIAFVAMAALSGLMSPSKEAPIAALYVGIAFAAVAFGMTLYEVTISSGSLLADTEFAEAVYYSQLETQAQNQTGRPE